MTRVVLTQKSNVGIRASADLKQLSKWHRFNLRMGLHAAQSQSQDGFSLVTDPSSWGGPREDTRATCGHAGTGFGLLINYNDMKAGQHMLRLESSDPSYVGASVNFNVTLPGDPLPFLSGLNAARYRHPLRPG